MQALIEAELNIPIANQKIILNGSELTDKKKTLAQLRVVQDDIFLVLGNAAVPAPSTANAYLPFPNICINPHLQSGSQSS